MRNPAQLQETTWICHQWLGNTPIKFRPARKPEAPRQDGRGNMNQARPAPEPRAHRRDHLRNIQRIGIGDDKRTLQSLPRRADRQQSANQIVERQKGTLCSKRTKWQRKG